MSERQTRTVKYEFAFERGQFRVFSPNDSSINEFFEFFQEAGIDIIDEVPNYIWLPISQNPHDVELSITYTTGK